MTRRTFVASIGAAAATHARFPDAAARQPRAYLFFDAAESRFIEPACARLIDPTAAASCTVGVQVAGYLDSQLSSPWGAGQRLYRIGPWQPGMVAFGPTASSPAAVFRNALQTINCAFGRRGTSFSALDPLGQLAFLRRLAAGTDVLDRGTSAVFFNLLLDMTVEGFFTASPLAHHRAVIAWPLKAYPGAYFREAGRL